MTMVSNSVQAGEEAWGIIHFVTMATLIDKIALLSPHPSKSEAIYSVRQHVTEQGWGRVEGWKVSVHMWTLPVCNARHNDSFNVCENRVPTFALQRGRFRDQFAHVAGLDIRQHATVSNVLQVIRDIVHHLFSWVGDNVFYCFNRDLGSDSIGFGFIVDNRNKCGIRD